jgi:YfiH family protein
VTAEFLHDPRLPAPHGFFTRNGGVSRGGFASLNASLSGRDDPDAVAENRARAARAIGADPALLSGLHQVHGIAVHVADAPVPVAARPQADAIVTRVAGLPIAVVTADCAPVLFACRASGVVGAAHAGWRGALAGVLEATLAAMQGLGARDVTAVIGPTIAQPSYEVAADLRDAVLARDGRDARFFAAGARADRWQFDLPGYCLARLAAAGVASAWIGADTLAEAARFFSHRRNTLAKGGPIGHQVSMIAAPG